MKKITSQQLTNNSEINKRILANDGLTTRHACSTSLADEIRRAYLEEELTREEVDKILYDVYHVDDMFSTLYPEDIEFLADFGYEHKRIVEKSMNSFALRNIIDQYRYLNELADHPIEHVREYAKKRIDEINEAKLNHPNILELMDKIDTSRFEIYELYVDSIKVKNKKISYCRSYSVYMRIVDCGDSFTIVLNYNSLPREQRQLFEELLHEYSFKKLENRMFRDHMEEGTLTGLSLEEVLQFIEKESHLKY
jgi:hypothetical protein